MIPVQKTVESKNQFYWIFYFWMSLFNECDSKYFLSIKDSLDSPGSLEGLINFIDLFNELLMTHNIIQINWFNTALGLFNEINNSQNISIKLKNEISSNITKILRLVDTKIVPNNLNMLLMNLNKSQGLNFINKCIQNQNSAVGNSSLKPINNSSDTLFASNANNLNIGNGASDPLNNNMLYMLALRNQNFKNENSLPVNLVNNVFNIQNNNYYKNAYEKKKVPKVNFQIKKEAKSPDKRNETVEKEKEKSSFKEKIENLSENISNEESIKDFIVDPLNISDTKKSLQIIDKKSNSKSKNEPAKHNSKIPKTSKSSSGSLLGKKRTNNGDKPKSSKTFIRGLSSNINEMEKRQLSHKSASSYINLTSFRKEDLEKINLIDNPSQRIKFNQYIKEERKFLLEKSKNLKYELEMYEPEFIEELKETLQDPLHEFMKLNFPCMYECEQFYLNHHKFKERRQSPNFKDHVVNFEYKNQENCFIKDSNLNSNLKSGYMNIRMNREMKKVWECDKISEDQVEAALFEIDRRFPLYEYHWKQETILELLMIQNYDLDSLLTIIGDSNFKEVIENQNVDVPNTIAYDETSQRKLSLRKKAKNISYALDYNS